MSQTPSERLRQVEAIANGTVIDHLPSAVTLKVANLISEPDDMLLIGVNFRSARHGTKGVVKISGRELSTETLSRLALLAPQATVCIIRDYKVWRKETVAVPERFVGIAICPNPNCITNHESCETCFDVVDDTTMRVRCHFCERTFLGCDLTIT
jgi:aspartate carbamoyltransferase regulatory subunit